MEITGESRQQFLQGGIVGVCGVLFEVDLWTRKEAGSSVVAVIITVVMTDLIEKCIVCGSPKSEQSARHNHISIAIEVIFSFNTQNNFTLCHGYQSAPLNL